MYKQSYPDYEKYLVLLSLNSTWQGGAVPIKPFQPVNSSATTPFITTPEIFSSGIWTSSASTSNFPQNNFPLTVNNNISGQFFELNKKYYHPIEEDLTDRHRIGIELMDRFDSLNDVLIDDTYIELRPISKIKVKAKIKSIKDSFFPVLGVDSEV